jgi:hypothetical protein
VKGKSSGRATDHAPTFEMFPAKAGRELQKIFPTIQSPDGFGASEEGEMADYGQFSCRLFNWCG